MEEICRGCLDKSDNCFSIFDLCERYNKSEKINKMFSTISDLEVKVGDGLPTKICYQCLENLSNAYQFRIQCQESHSNFRENFLHSKIEEIYLIESESQNEVKEETLKSKEVDIISKEDINKTIDDETNSSEETLQYIKEEYYNNNEKRKMEKIKQDKSSTKKFNVSDFPCHDCKSSFTHRTKLLEHIKKIHLPLSENNKIYCDICKRCFASIRSLSNHLQTHSKNNEIQLSGEKIKCSLCRRQYSHTILLSNHIKLYHKIELEFGEKKTGSCICSICQKICVTRTEYNLHSQACRLHNSDRICQYCNKFFKSNLSVMAHIRIAHKDVTDSNKIKKFICHICRVKFSFKLSLEQHLLVHQKRGEGENVPCPFCAKIFRTKVRVTRHIRAIHNKEKRHKCEFCDCEYFYSYALKMHQLRHHLNKANYICLVCDKAFFASCELTVHLRKHNNDSKYKCEIEGCNKVCLQLSQLKFHIRSSHTGERNFKCKNCDKNFITKQHLKQHSDRNHPETPRQRTHICTICQNGFYTKNVLTKHVKYVHEKVKR